MTQEEKQLLLVDLCARLRSGVIVSAHYKDGEGWKTEDRKLLGIYEDGQVYIDCAYTNVENVKPYLRPMSSMTEEELNEYRSYCRIHLFNSTCIYENTWKSIDYLNSNHFDYRGLIPMNLALEAPKGMYNF